MSRVPVRQCGRLQAKLPTLARDSASRNLSTSCASAGSMALPTCPGRERVVDGGEW